MNFINAIEELAKSENLHSGNIPELTREVLKRSADVLSCDRCNAWVYNKAEDQLESIASFNSSKSEFYKEAPLRQSDLPNYFSFLNENKLIVSVSAQDEPINAELVAGYLKPNNIKSMIDVPLRSEGDIVGLICFEKVEIEHEWTEDEQKFAQSVGQLLSLGLETNEKKNFRRELEKIILQKEALLAEINHRVKNNLSVIVSLLNLQAGKAKDTFHYQLFSEIKDKVYSIAAVQEQLLTSDNIDRIDFSKYIVNLSENIRTSYGQEKTILVELSLEAVQLDVSRAIPCGLIVNEILTNSYKYAFNAQNETPVIQLSLRKVNNCIEILVRDNGVGFDKKEVKKGMGIELIQGLADQIDGKMVINSENGVEVGLIFPL